MKAVLILAAVAASATANVVPRGGASPIEMGGSCIVLGKKSDSKHWNIGVGDCKGALHFSYDASTTQLKCHPEPKKEWCLAADKEGKPCLKPCAYKPAQQWTVSEGSKWTNGQTCTCLDKGHKGCELAECSKASKCGYDAMPSPSKPKCAAETPARVVCPPGSYLATDGRCYSSYQCKADNNCAAGQQCSGGWCCYPKPQCDYWHPCSKGYTCSYGQCVAQKPVCPPGSTLQGYWCVPDHSQCGWKNPCPPGSECKWGKCVPFYQGCNDVSNPCPPGSQCNQWGKCVPFYQGCNDVTNPCPPGSQCNQYGKCVPFFQGCDDTTNPCAAGQVCVNGKCRQALQPGYCYTQADCGTSGLCKNGVCVQRPAQPGDGCNAGFLDACPAGYHCTRGTCLANLDCSVHGCARGTCNQATGQCQ